MKLENIQPCTVEIKNVSGHLTRHISSRTIAGSKLVPAMSCVCLFCAALTHCISDFAQSLRVTLRLCLLKF